MRTRGGGKIQKFCEHHIRKPLEGFRLTFIITYGNSFQVLLDRYSLTSMEEVFLRLSTDDDASERVRSKASSVSYLDNWGSRQT